MHQSRRNAVVFLAVLVAGAALGYFLKSVQVAAQEFGKSGRPVVLEDVSDEKLQRFGAPFSRPPGAKNVVLAAVGNGVGDVVWYAALEVPDKKAVALLNDLKASGKIRPARYVPEAYYLDQLSPELARRLWPADEISQAHTYISRTGYVAYVPGTASIHIYGWPQIEQEFNDPTVQGGGVSDKPAPRPTPK